MPSLDDLMHAHGRRHVLAARVLLEVAGVVVVVVVVGVVVVVVVVVVHTHPTSTPAPTHPCKAKILQAKVLLDCLARRVQRRSRIGGTKRRP